MYRIAIYGKGGIGKSTTISNLASAFVQKGLTVLQIGCDPKADSTIYHHNGRSIQSVLDILRSRADGKVRFEEIVHRAPSGVWCVEAGGPSPGTGCAGRGIVATFEALTSVRAFEIIQPDIVLFDVLGDVVCGGFAMPIRKGYADHVFIVTSGENMAIYAAGNIAQAIKNFKNRGYAKLSGIILNRRNVQNEVEKVQELAQACDSEIIYQLPRSSTVQQAEELQSTVVDAFPQSSMANEYMQLADALLTKVQASKTNRVIPIQTQDLRM